MLNKKPFRRRMVARSAGETGLFTSHIMDSPFNKIIALFTIAGLLAVSLLVTGCGKGFRKGYRIENDEVVIYTGFPADRRVIPDADADSFTGINTEFGKDQNHAFYLGRIIPNADPATFVYLAGSYAKDKNKGYSEDHIISHDGPHFTIIPNPDETPANVTAQGIAYAHDSRRVYKGTWVVEGADPATFTVAAYLLSKAKNGNDSSDQGATGKK